GGRVGPHAMQHALLEEPLRAELAALAQRSELRTLSSFPRSEAPLLAHGDRVLINFSSNNYLGLDSHPKIQQAARDGLGQGSGACASRLLTGPLPAHSDLERALAVWSGAEAALVFNTGYTANLGVLSALAGPDDLLCSDELNHASTIDGCRLARARVHVY